MKTTLINGKAEIINETFEEAFDTLNDWLEELGFPHISEKEARMDWCIKGGETNAELKMYARDFASEMHTAKCEAKDAWRYEN